MLTESKRDAFDPASRLELVVLAFIVYARTPSYPCGVWRLRFCGRLGKAGRLTGSKDGA
jgi:hypothetical protein